MIHHSTDIIEAVAYAFDVTPKDITGPCRERRYVIPRQVACQIMRDHTDLSMPQIGRVLHRDHTTVLHALRQYPKHAADQETATRIDRAKAKLVGGVFKSRRAA